MMSGSNVCCYCSLFVSGDISAEDLFRMFFGGHAFTASMRALLMACFLSVIL